jgi:hypothetical protein
MAVSPSKAPWLRWIFVEAAVVASRRPGVLRDRFMKIARRKNAKTARVALARHLAAVAYLLLSRATVYEERSSRQSSWSANLPGHSAESVVA